MNLPPSLSPLEEQLLQAVYRHQFDRGDDTRTEGLDWLAWAAEAGVPKVEARDAVDDLTERHFIEDDDAFGARVRLRLGGILRAEKSPAADPVFVARQKSIRRHVLAALLSVKDKESPFSGRTVAQLALEIGEPAGDVLANYGVLRDMGFVTGAAGGKLIRIADGGVKAMGNGTGTEDDSQDGYVGWPLG